MSSAPSEAPRRIRALDQDIVNKIAAGEIIVAPVHALKELAENAVDAGSTSIEILVKDGGLKLLQITDNGQGINRDDLPILCERFTTSKLKVFEDLSSIGTYGFRGEALASISHIAHLRVTTRTKESSCAWQGHYSAGKLVSPKPGQSADPKATAGRQGTQITVEDLFYNVPTRRKAFRSASDEYAKILDLIGRYAVHCAGVAFTCKKHGDSSMSLTVQQNATTVDRIRTIHGVSIANSLLSIQIKNEQWGFQADGWVTSANHHGKKIALLLFINHRSVESSVIKKAIEQAYATLLPKGSHPFVYLSLEIEPHRVDVNVHPTKREVRFLNEDEIIDLVCDEIRTKLGKVDTSRTFMTQSLLLGVKIPTISADSISTPRRTSSTGDLQKPTQSTQKQRQMTPSTKPYENNLVRTDTNLRKITSMLPQTQRSTINLAPRLPDGANRPPDVPNFASEDSVDYSLTAREPVICRLASIKHLRAAVRDAMHAKVTEIFTDHTFVGIVDCSRRLAAIQSRVKLYLVDYGLISNEYFYQLGLTDFANFGTIRIDPPLDLRAILAIAARNERKKARDGDMIDWDEVVEMAAQQLVDRRDMMIEYFSLEVSTDGYLLTLPLLVKGYMPSMTKLPRFLLRLGPHVNWEDEEACFRTFLRELAGWYVPDAMPPPPPKEKKQMEEEDVVMDDAGETEQEDPEIAAGREELNRAVETVLFPAFKARLIGTKGMVKGVTEVANLKGLYRVFERC